MYVSWTQAGPYFGVSIAVTMNSFDGLPATGTAYLTTQTGAAATAAVEIARAPTISHSRPEPTIW